jgi:nicotinate-nucleotide adenylyltransferase
LRLGVLGGTFDPVHYAHLRLAERAREAQQLSLDRVLFVPAGRPWRKSDRVVSEGRHRAAMLQLAVGDNALFEVSTLELERAGPSYTVDTLEDLHELHPDSELFLIMGEDALADLANWREPERIMDLATLAVASRGGKDIAAAGQVLPHFLERVVWIEMEALEISASRIRENVRMGASIRYLVPDAVLEYIREQALYHS